MPARGDLSEKETLIKLASESAAEEKELSDFMDMKYEMARDKYLENNPGKTEEDFIETIRRIKLESGGKVIDFAKYKKDNDWHTRGDSLRVGTGRPRWHRGRGAPHSAWAGRRARRGGDVMSWR